MEIVDFIGDVIGIDWYENASLEITTDDGRIECFKGDYIVKDHKGKIRVYEADEFKKNYSEVEEL
nr:MAG TPA: PGDYG protein [Caudoviricetes sp.]